MTRTREGLHEGRLNLREWDSGLEGEHFRIRVVHIDNLRDLLGMRKDDRMLNSRTRNSRGGEGVGG